LDKRGFSIPSRIHFFPKTVEEYFAMTKAILSIMVSALAMSVAGAAFATNPPNRSGTGTPGQANEQADILQAQPDEYAAPSPTPSPPVVAQGQPDEYAAQPMNGAPSIRVLQAQADEYAAPSLTPSQPVIARAEPDEYAAQPVNGAPSISESPVEVALLADGYSQITETASKGTDHEAQAMKDGQLVKIVVDATTGRVKSETLG
jgi:hypothetical protein